MQNDLEVMSALDRIAELSSAWDAMVHDDPSQLNGVDATSTHAWFEATVLALPEAKDPRVLVAREAGEVLGILPLVATRSDGFGTELRVFTDLYGGRNGPLLKKSSTEIMQLLLSGIRRAYPRWITLEFTMVAGSPQAAMFQQSCHQLGHPLHSRQTQPSPFFPLKATGDAFRAGVSKSVQQMLRTSRNKAAKLGVLSFREFHGQDEASELFDVVLGIERQSWKHAAGSAITTQPRQEAFYRALFPRAAKQGILLGLVLYLDGTPIAYNFGLKKNQVFSCLKHSNIVSQEKLSPSYLVLAELFDRLRDSGIQTFDFMGKADPHKLRWSDQNCEYNRISYTVFNSSIKGRMLAATRRLKASLSGKLKTRDAGKTSKESEL